ncbi:LOW QUALITY PROTEIN: uncharacterized protein LOC129223297 [Uloborus diversus]|uniref:LOW QUALITY PROTEIN: uncharacterized protein LOC129223297 n=1 Tax=Uloborus diversus TaxID=327109 RepID=UPI0024095DB8|nr:LOW QUALITY PROTEIN: uncharacterized protein LOC129223297 [Uloborus diversus]
MNRQKLSYGALTLAVIVVARGVACGPTATKLSHKAGVFKDFASENTKVSLSCRSKDIVVNLAFTHPFRGLVHAGRKDGDCSFRGDGNRTYSLNVPHTSCGTIHVTPQDSFANTLTIRYHPALELEGDEIKTILCKYGTGSIQLDNMTSSRRDGNFSIKTTRTHTEETMTTLLWACQWQYLTKMTSRDASKNTYILKHIFFNTILEFEVYIRQKPKKIVVARGVACGPTATKLSHKAGVFKDFASENTKVSLSCRSKDIVVNLAFTHPFRGLVHAGRKDGDCSFRGDGNRTYSLNVPHTSCGTITCANSMAPSMSYLHCRVQTPQDSFANTLTIRYHPALELEGDEIKTILCKVRNRKHTTGIT